MTKDFFLGQLRLIAVALIAYSTGKGWLSTADAGLAAQIGGPVGLILAPWIWSIYSNLNSKLVPKEAIAISPDKVNVNAPDTAPQPAKGDFVTVAPGAVKVVGCLLAMLMVLSFSAPAFAQLPKLTGNFKNDFAIPSTAKNSGAGTSVDGAVQSFGDGVQKIEKAIVDKGIADLNAAITDATNHNDVISLPCWQANLALLQSLPSQWPEPPTLPMGIALSIQIQRDLLNAITGSDTKSLKVACAALWGDQLKIVANLGALIGIRIASGGLF